MKRKYTGIILVLLIIAFIVSFPMIGCKKITINPTTTTITSAAAQGREVKVIMQNRIYEPKSITVTVGTKVTWINQDAYGHNIVSGTRGAADAGSLFKSDNINQGDSFSYTFTKAGTYPYFCSVHPGMDGTIIVK